MDYRWRGAEVYWTDGIHTESVAGIHRDGDTSIYGSVAVDNELLVFTSEGFDRSVLYRVNDADEAEVVGELWLEDTDGFLAPFTGMPPRFSYERGGQLFFGDSKSFFKTDGSMVTRLADHGIGIGNPLTEYVSFLEFDGALYANGKRCVQIGGERKCTGVLYRTDGEQVEIAAEFESPSAFEGPVIEIEFGGTMLVSVEGTLFPLMEIRLSSCQIKDPFRNSLAAPDSSCRIAAGT